MRIRNMKQTYFVELRPSSTCDRHTTFRKLRMLPSSGMETRSPPEKSCCNCESGDRHKVRQQTEGTLQLNQPSSKSSISELWICDFRLNILVPRTPYSSSRCKV